MVATEERQTRYQYVGLPLSGEQKRAFELHRKARRTTATQVLDDALREYFEQRGMEWPANPKRTTS